MDGMKKRTWMEREKEHGWNEKKKKKNDIPLLFPLTAESVCYLGTKI